MEVMIRDIPGFDGKYQITSDGDVISCNYRRLGYSKVMDNEITKWGYRQALLSRNNKRYHKKVSRLVAEAFVPNPNNLPQVNHIDGDKQHDKWTNLEWTDNSGNQRHARDNGLLPFCKLNMSMANEIRNLYKTGNYTQENLAEKYGLCRQNISRIVLNKQWVEV